MKLIWKKTGDFLDFEPSNLEFALYYIRFFDKEFSLVDSNVNYDLYDELKKNVLTVNEILEKKFNIDPLVITGPLYSQEVLNRLHESWVKLHVTNPKLSLIFAKLDSNLKKKLDDINQHIHRIENMFSASYQCYSLHVEQIDNIFGAHILDHGKFDMVINYDNLGRSNFNKWKFEDDNTIDIDTNNFIKIGGKIELDLSGRNFKRELPKEYIKYCEARNILPLPDDLPLGNFLNKELAKALFIRNIKIEGNPIILEI